MATLVLVTVASVFVTVLTWRSDDDHDGQVSAPITRYDFLSDFGLGFLWARCGRRYSPHACAFLGSSGAGCHNDGGLNFDDDLHHVHCLSKMEICQ
jgi:hypothetical protein